MLSNLPFVWLARPVGSMLVARQPTPKWTCHISDISDSQGLQGSGIQFQEEPRSQLEYWAAVSGRLQCYAGKWLEYLGCYQVFNKRSDFTFSCWTSLLFHLDHRRGDKEAESEGTQAPFSPWCMFSSVAQLCLTLWPKPMSIKSVMPSSYLIPCRPLLLLLPIPPSIRVFSNESTLHMRWPEYWSFSFNISPSNEHPGLISFRIDWLDLLAVHGLSRVFSNTIVQNHQLFGAQLSSQSNSHIHTWPLEKP